MYVYRFSLCLPRQNADWGHFVNLGQISSVVMHSDRSLGKSRTGDRLPPSSCSGVWFTLYGPRVSWGQRLRKMTDPETQKPYMEAGVVCTEWCLGIAESGASQVPFGADLVFPCQVVGSPDGNHLGAALAKGEALHWLRLEIGLKSADVPDLRRELPEEGQIEVFGDQGSEAWGLGGKSWRGKAGELRPGNMFLAVQMFQTTSRFHSCPPTSYLVFPLDGKLQHKGRRSGCSIHANQAGKSRSMTCSDSIWSGTCAC